LARTQSNCLRAGYDHHRSLAYRFSSGPVSPQNISGQTAHLVGSSQQHSHCCGRHRL